MAQTNQFCTFYLDKLMFGVELKKVQEVIRYLEITPIPLAPRIVSGLMNLRGQIVTGLDLRRRLDLPDRPEDTLRTVTAGLEGGRGFRRGIEPIKQHRQLMESALGRDSKKAKAILIAHVNNCVEYAIAGAKIR
jgi:hypothetical protein